MWWCVFHLPLCCPNLCVGHEQARESLEQLAAMYEKQDEPAHAASYHELVLKSLKQCKPLPKKDIQRVIISILRLRMAALSLDMQYTLVRTKKEVDDQIPRSIYQEVIQRTFKGLRGGWWCVCFDVGR